MKLPPYKPPHPTPQPNRALSFVPAGRIVWQEYVPLVALVVVAVLVASAKDASYGPDGRSLRWLHDFMGILLVFFALLKLFDLSAFADAFQQYDLLGRRSRRYALAYPFIELALGLGYLAFWQPVKVYLATMVVLGVGALGVISTLARSFALKGGSPASPLKVPFSTVALVADIALFAMAAGLWLRLR